MQEVARQFGDKCPTERPLGSRGCGGIPYFHGQIQSPRSCRLIDAQFPGRLPKHSARVAAFPPARHSTGFKHNYTLGCQVRSTNSIGGGGDQLCQSPSEGPGGFHWVTVVECIRHSGHPPDWMFSGTNQERSSESALDFQTSSPPFPSLRSHTQGEKNPVVHATHSFPNSSGLFFYFCVEQLIFHKPGLSARGPFCTPQSHKHK